VWEEKKWSRNEEFQLSSFFALTKRGLFICDDAANMVNLSPLLFSDHNIENIQLF